MSETTRTPELMSEDNMPDIDEVTPVKVVTTTEVQTKDNTLVKNPCLPQNPDLGEPKDSVDANFSVDFFLNLTDDVMDKYSNILTNWLAYQTALQEKDKGEISASEFNAIETTYRESCEKHLPNKSLPEVDKFCQNFYTFSNQILDWNAFDTKAINSSNLSNRIRRATDVETPTINAIMPGARKNKNFSLAELIRRDYRRVSAEPENFDTFLANSFIHLRTKRPDVIELGRLIKRIVNTIRGFVRDINVNSVTVSRIAGYRVVFDFLMGKTINSNVKDITDFNQLSSLILLSDFKHMLVELTNSAYWEGVDFNFTCLTPGCDFKQVRKIDLKETVYVDTTSMTDEQAAAYANMMNMVKRFTPEEIKALQEQNKFDGNRIYSEDKLTYLVLRMPSMLTCFECFDFLREKLDPEVAALRNSVLDNQEYEAQLTKLVSSLGFCEYIHWVDEIHLAPREGVDEEEIVYKRSDDSMQFNEGLYSILESNEKLRKDLIIFVNKNGEDFGRTVVGIPNYICPKCHKPSSDEETNNQHLNGITPYDPFMHFFTRSQLEQTKAVYRMQTLGKEIR